MTNHRAKSAKKGWKTCEAATKIPEANAPWPNCLAMSKEIWVGLTTKSELVPHVRLKKIW